MGRFSEKVAIITGSSFGIGRETAILFASEGAKVTVTGRNEQRLQDTRRALLAAGIPEDRFHVVSADLTSSEGQDRLIGETVAKFGRIDILVNNAGAKIQDSQKGVDQSIDTYEKTLRLNVQTVVEMTQKIRPHLAKSHGDIVNVSSIAALPFGWPGSPYYPLAKAALDQYTRSSAVDLIAEGIRVNAVNPGVVVTGFHEQATGLPEEDCTKFYNAAAAERTVIPCGFVGQPRHIAKVIAFLADREASSFIVGQNIVADGGTSLVLGLHAHAAKK